MKIKNLKNIFFSIIIVFLYSCDNSDSSDTTSNEKVITSFSISNKKAKINELAKTISLIVNEKDLSSLKPTITISPKATISPASGSEQDFSSPVIYTVTAEDGSVSKYTSIITYAPRPLSSAKGILNFSFSNIKTEITKSTDNFLLTISETDFTSLSPKITISKNATISPASGSVQDFSSPITYTVTAEDGSTKDYTVTVQSSIYTFSYSGKKYEVVKENETWFDAVLFAKSRGGHLVEINSKEEQDAVFLELNQNAGIEIKNTLNQFSKGAVWLGGHDLTSEGNWIWDGDNNRSGDQFWTGGLDGKVVGGNYENWGLEPDNSGNQDVLSISLQNTPRNKPSEWNDLDGNTNKLYFVIEYN